MVPTIQAIYSERVMFWDDTGEVKIYKFEDNRWILDKPDTFWYTDNCNITGWFFNGSEKKDEDFVQAMEEVDRFLEETKCLDTKNNIPEYY